MVFWNSGGSLLSAPSNPRKVLLSDIKSNINFQNADIKHYYVRKLSKKWHRHKININISPEPNPRTHFALFVVIHKH